MTNYLSTRKLRTNKEQEFLKNKKSYLSREVFKNALFVGANSLFDTFSNKHEIVGAINNSQLSHNTIIRSAAILMLNLNQIWIGALRFHFKLDITCLLWDFTQRHLN